MLEFPRSSSLRDSRECSQDSHSATGWLLSLLVAAAAVADVVGHPARLRTRPERGPALSPVLVRFVFSLSTSATDLPKFHPSGVEVSLPCPLNRKLSQVWIIFIYRNHPSQLSSTKAHIFFLTRQIHQIHFIRIITRQKSQLCFKRIGHRSRRLQLFNNTHTYLLTCIYARRRKKPVRDHS